MAHKDWMKAGRKVLHKVDITSYKGPSAYVYVSTLVEYAGKEFNNMTTDANIQKINTNYGSGKNVGFFDGPEASIHLMSETLAYNLENGTENERGNARLATGFVSDLPYGPNGEVDGSVDGDAFSINVDAIYKPTSRYFQISGNNNTNDFPVNFEIRNKKTEELYIISGNSKVDFILDFGKETDVSQGLEIRIYKWSKPYSSVKFSYIGFDVTFDASDLLRSYSLDDGCAYDGGDNFSYGVKSNSGTVSLFKDKRNLAKCKTRTSYIETPNISNDSFAETAERAIQGKNDGVKNNLGERVFSVRYNEGQDWSFKLFASQDMNWNINTESGNFYTGYTVFSINVFNDSNKEWRVNPIHCFFPFGHIASGQNDATIVYKKIMFPTNSASVEDMTIPPQSWKTFTFAARNNSNPGNTVEASRGDRYVNISTQIEPAQIIFAGGEDDYNRTIYVRNIKLIHLTEEQAAEFGVVEGELLDNNFIESTGPELTSFILAKYKSNIRAVSKIQSVVDNENSNVKISVATLGTTYSQICNMWVSSYDYDQNGIGVILNLTDILTKMNELVYPGSVAIDKTDIRVYDYVAGKVIQEAFPTTISLQGDLKLNFENINIDSEPNIQATMENFWDKADEKYFSILDSMSKATNTFFIQDQKNEDLVFKYCNKDYCKDIFQISNGQCYSIEDRRHEKNSIKRIDMSPTLIRSSSPEYAENIVYEETSFTKSIFDSYILGSGGEKSDYPYGPFLLVKDPSVSGSFTIPLSEYRKYDKFVVAFKCVTAYRKWRGAPGVVSEIIGEVDESSITGSNVSASPRLYIKDENTYTEDLSLIEENALTVFYGSSQIKIEGYDDNNITLSYSATRSPLNYSSIFGPQFTLPIDQLWSEPVYEQKYIGAYKIAIYGQKNIQEYSDFTYGESFGNALSIRQDTFIQQDGYDWHEDYTKHDLSMAIAKDIYEEYKNGKKIAKIEYIGSPYLKVYDIITLENGISYRLLKIKHISNGGGFKQQLTLMEKE